MDTLLNSHERRYISTLSDDGVSVLTKGSRVALRKAQEKYEIAEEKRLIEEAKVCTFAQLCLTINYLIQLPTNPHYDKSDVAY